MTRILSVVVVLMATPCLADQVSVGSGQFTFADPQGNSDRPIRVFYVCPRRFNANTPIVFVMHGVNRNADSYRDSWAEYANRKHFLLLCPEFSSEHYAGSRRYNLGYMFKSDGESRPKAKWSFYAIERIFDQVVKENRLKAKDYFLYGHSAGGQFVHRMVLFLPEARFSVAIAANPGWYTMPQSDVAFPYGLGNTDTDSEQLMKSFGRRFVLLLGGDDTDPADKNLNKSSEAMKQGPHRLARGREFVQQCDVLARQLKTKVNWQMQVVPNVGHSNAKMAAVAATFVR